MNTKILLLSIIAITGAALFFTSQVGQSTNDLSRQVQVAQFASFRNEFGRQYSSVVELEYRFGVFQSNQETIESHNADTTSSYTLEVNEFADLTYEEFAAKYLGANEELSGNARCEKTGNDSFVFDDEKEVDWVKAGVVHPVKNQAACGSCWAFAATAALESAYAIFKDQKNLDLSEQELVDCSRKYGNNGCSGGLMHFAYDYILDKGINCGKKYPYTAKNGQCKTEISGTGPHKLTGCRQIPVGVDNIVAPTRKQPVAVAFHVQDDFRFYKTGVYNPKGCTSHPNHAVTVVGFKLDHEIPYLHIKNSWGTQWGNAGFFNMSMGKGRGTCNVGGTAWNYYPLV